MSTNYFMSEAFRQDAAKAVREAVAEANAHGLPKAYKTRTVPGNYIMSEQFNIGAAESVHNAVAKADALGLPKAYDEAPSLPEQPVIVTITPSRRKK
jgi:hypothetical protein